MAAKGNRVGGPPGPGGRLVAFNRTQWLGNYNAAGVNAIEMDVINPSATERPKKSV